MDVKRILKVNGAILELSDLSFYNIQTYLESNLIAYKEQCIKEVKVDIEKGFKTDEISRILSISGDDFEIMIRKSTISFTD